MLARTQGSLCPIELTNAIDDGNEIRGWDYAWETASATVRMREGSSGCVHAAHTEHVRASATRDDEPRALAQR